MILISCATAPQPTTAKAPLPDPGVVSVSVVVTPKNKRIIPKGSRIVITDIAGDCADEVKDALMRRLIDNSDYDVLTRDNLRQIIGEAEFSWGGKFDTETAAKLGELLGASLFIVGRVVYCGYLTSDVPDSNEGEFNVFATLQILDLETGKVLVSSANEGKYIPRPAPVLTLNSLGQDIAALTETVDTAMPSDITAAVKNPTPHSKPGILKSLGKRILGPGGTSATEATPQPLSEIETLQIPELQLEPVTYIRIKAAEEMANGFADKFFARPSWEQVELWDDPHWNYSKTVIRYVRLGRCPEAVNFLESTAYLELSNMQESDVAKYLHNYGVALLCANNPELAMKKLRSAYRIDYNQTTLKMLGLAGKIIEWSLNVEVDQQPEVDMLMERGAF